MAYPEKIAQLFKYPADVANFNKWVRFDARSGRHVGRSDIVTPENNQPDSIVMSTAMYLPTTALKSSTKANYDTAEFSGLMAELSAQAMTTAARSVLGLDASSRFGDSLLTALKAPFTNTGNPQNTVVSTFGEWAKEKSLSLGSAVLGDQIAALTGQVVNPRTEVIFKAQDYRTWTFDYLMVPRTEEEAISIQAIIKFFNFYMLPSYRNTLPSNNPKVGNTDKAYAYMMGYPYEFTITMYGTGPASFQGKPYTAGSPLGGSGTDNTVELIAGYNAGPNLELQHINKIGRVVLTNITVDQAAGGEVAFASNQNRLYPLVTSMTLEFQEVVLLGRDSTDIFGDDFTNNDPLY